MKFNYKKFIAFLIVGNVFLPMFFSSLSPAGCDCYWSIQLWCSIIFTPAVSFPALIGWLNIKQYNREHEIQK